MNVRFFLTLCLMVLVSSATWAGQPGKALEKFLERSSEFELIRKHEKDLAITDKQKKDLSDLEDKVTAERKKLRESKEATNIAVEMREARRGDDEAKTRELRQKMMGLLSENPETSPQAVQGKIAQILTPDQQAKLRTLRENDPDRKEMREKMRDTMADRGNRKDAAKAPTNNKPDPSTGVPKLYENEK